jgi:hypothetical protein
MLKNNRKKKKRRRVKVIGNLSKIVCSQSKQKTLGSVQTRE